MSGPAFTAPQAAERLAHSAMTDRPSDFTVATDGGAPNDHFRAAVETMLDAFGVYTAVRDADGQIVDFRVEYVNDTACAWNRMTREEQVGKNLCDLLPGHRQSELFQQYVHVVESGESLARQLVQYRDVYGDGQELERAFDLRVAKFGDGFTVTWRDVTSALQESAERERLAAASRESEARFRAVQDNSPDGCIVMRAMEEVASLGTTQIVDFEFRYVNTTGATLLGARSPDDLVGRQLKRTYPGVVQEGLFEWYLEVLESGRSASRVLDYHRDGFSGTYRITAIPIAEGLALTWNDVTEASSAEAARDRALARTAILQDVTAALAAALDPIDVANVIAERGREALGASAAAVALVSDESETLDFVSWVGYPSDRSGWQNLPLAANTPLTETLRHLQPLWVRSRAHWRERWPNLESITFESSGAWAMLPLIADGRALGALSLSFAKPQRFDEDERAFGLALAQVASQAMARAQAFSIAQRARARAERLQALAAALSAATTREDVADAFLREGVAPLRVQVANVVTVASDNPDKLDMLRSVGLPPDLVSRFTRIAIDDPIPAAEAVRSRQMIVVNGREELLERYPVLRPVTEALGIDGIAVMPLIVGDRVLGAFGLGFRGSHSLSRDDRALFIGMAQQCAQAMDRARLLEAERAARAEVERERADLAAVLQVVPLGIGIASDPSCSDIRVNPAFATQLGIRVDVNASKNPENPEPLPFVVLRDGQEVPAPELPIQRAVSEGRPIMGEIYEIRHDDGRSIDLLEYAVPLFDEGGRVRGAVGAFVDITEREQLLEAERQSRAEAEAARRAADEANRAKSDFLAVMSHELRTPLNAIAGYVELMELGIRGPVTSEQRADLERIRAAQRGLLQRINDVLNFAKLEAGHVDFDVGEHPVSELVSRIEPFVAPQVSAKQISFICEQPEPELRVRADLEKAVQVLINLTANAVKFTGPGGSVTVAARRRENGDVAISVRDTGVGIPGDKLAGIFDPFVQVNPSLTREQPGTGLGLAISRDLARGMAGDLEVESTEGVGSTFTFVLPSAGKGRNISD